MKIFCSCLLWLWTASLGASDRTVFLTTGPNYYPLTDARKPDGGRATRIVAAAFQILNKEPRIEWLPWKRGFQMTIAGKFQATFPYLKTPDREEEFFFSDPLLTEESLLWTRIGSHLSMDAPATFKGATLCAGVGYASVIEETLKPKVEFKDIEIFRPQNRESCVLMLAAGRVDAISGLKDEILPIIEANKLADRVTYVAKPIRTIPLHLIAPKRNRGSLALIQDFNRALKQMQADGSYKKLSER